MGIDESTGLSDALPSSLRIDITKADATSPVGVYNDGYWGMALRPDIIYKGSSYAKADSVDMGAVTLSLVNDNSGAVLVTTVAPTLSTEYVIKNRWRHQSCCRRRRGDTFGK